MTIKLRKSFYWAFFAVSLTGLSLASAAFLARPAGLEAARAFYPSEPAAYYTVVASTVASSLYAVIVTGLVAILLGRTVSIELFFFALWAFCQGLEIVKLAPAFLASRGSSALVLEFVTRSVSFGRYLGVISLFLGSIFAVGYRQERTLALTGAAALVALFFASVHPLNSGSIGVDMLSGRGFLFMTRSFELAIVCLGLANYAVAWRASKDADFLAAGAGMALCAAASAVARTATRPVAAALVLCAFAAGTWLHAKSLHDHYLWR